MKINKKIVIIIIAVIAAAAIFVCISFTKKSNESIYSEVKNKDSYLIESQKLNTTISADYELCKGDSVKVEMICKNGKCRIEIEIKGQEAIYSGNAEEVISFEVNIPTDGSYTISVTGEKFEGNLRFEIIKSVN